MALMLVCQYAVNTQLLAALLAVSLNWLHVGYMSIAKLSDEALLVDEGLVGIHIQQTGLL